MSIALYPGQLALFEVRGPSEVLIATGERTGSTTALLAYAVGRCLQRVEQVVLAVADGSRIRADYLAGPGRLWAMLEAQAQAGACRFLPGGVVQFGNRSTLAVCGFEAAARRAATLLLVDDADGFGAVRLEELAERMVAHPRGGEGLPRLVMVAKRAGEGWVREWWESSRHAGAARLNLPAELPEELRRLAPPAPPLTFAQYVDRVQPSWEWYPHTALIAGCLQEVIDGKVSRLLITCPPRYQKSWMVSRFGPAYALHRYPEWLLGLVCSTGRLALSMSKVARELYRRGGGALDEGSQDAAGWRTDRGGGLWCRGVGAAILGEGFNLGIIDDPFPQRLDAIRRSNQERVWDYYRSDFYSRRQLGSANPAAIVVLHQRLDEGDLAGRLLEAEKGDAPEHWTVVDLPAVKRPRQVAYPTTCRLIDDGRKLGEVLCPTFHTREELEREERRDAILFAALYQQDPKPSRGGGLFGRDFWRLVGDPDHLREGLAEELSLTELIAREQEAGRLPNYWRQVRAWDLAATEGAGDHCASVRAGIEGTGADARVTYLDAFERQVDGAFVRQLILATARADGPAVEVVLPQEPGAAGKILGAELEAALRAIERRVVFVRPTGSKRARALPHAGAAAPLPDGTPGRCLILRGAWNDAFVEQHFRFTGTDEPARAGTSTPREHDDLVDAASDAFSVLAVTDAAPYQPGKWRRAAAR